MKNAAKAETRTAAHEKYANSSGTRITGTNFVNMASVNTNQENLMCLLESPHHKIQRRANSINSGFAATENEYRKNELRLKKTMYINICSLSELVTLMQIAIDRPINTRLKNPKNSIVKTLGNAFTIHLSNTTKGP
jgi:hypothetical protein